MLSDSNLPETGEGAKTMGLHQKKSVSPI